MSLFILDTDTLTLYQHGNAVVYAAWTVPPTPPPATAQPPPASPPKTP